MKKTTLILSTLAIVLSAGTAYAEGFTYVSTATTTKTVGGIGPTGTDYMGGYAEGTSKVVREDGTKLKASYVCVSTGQPGNSKIFDVHMACDITAEDGTFSMVAGCQIMNEDGGEMSCVGGMQGKTGAYEGRSGNLSQHAKDGTSKGSGQWFD
jgi:hypothetical protein